MEYESSSDPLRTAGIIVGIILIISGGISLAVAEANAINSAKNLDYISFGNNLVSLILIGIVLIISGIFVEIIFGGRKRRYW